MQSVFSCDICQSLVHDRAFTGTFNNITGSFPGIYQVPQESQSLLSETYSGCFVENTKKSPHNIAKLWK